MHKMTEKTLLEAFSGESQANTKYQIYADLAREDGKENIARLFEAIAYAERVHARNHLRALGKKFTAADNLQDAIDGETFEVEEMYQAYLAVAQLQEEKAAVTSHRYALEAEKIHAAMYAEALKAVQSDQDIELGDVFICPTCGHTVENAPPERCPICGVPGSKFRKY